MPKLIPHLYGEITKIKREPRRFVITISDKDRLLVPPSADDSVKKMKQGDRILIDMTPWEKFGYAHVVVLRQERNPSGLERLGYPTFFVIGKDVCRLELAKDQ